ncbi:MAG: geranylgeranylglyceryl/heptaprenylglyceryl phosphate synthase [Bacteroidales bacterium]|nr:geranylgeranylglyceryl/heptaprenylglyceryl phosphate synthase [Bacteroidales bacterium]MBN2698176.1 geranylgeranylglyceryl/heptaprenylglyceryl phosphate synthase [Bacteroidales bacterium]
MKSLSQKLKERSGKKVAILIDPDKYEDKSLDELILLINKYPPDLLLVGGSMLMSPIDIAVTTLKLYTSVPVFIFPGNVLQLSDRADGIFLLSLISGRNPDFLIGNQVLAAPHLKRAGIEVIPTGYMLIENGRYTSVEYMSHTRPIPAEKTDIAISTAIAGEMLGLKVIYLEAGSGAAKPVNEEMIRAIRKNISLPLIVGGGIRTKEEAGKIFRAGADMIVVGTAIEQNPELLRDFVSLRKEFRS